MSTLLVCSLESFAQSDVEKNDSIWKDFDLASVTVVASKPLVKMETDKMTYNVQQDAEAKAFTVLDMLRKVPMVTRVCKVHTDSPSFLMNTCSWFFAALNGKA